MDNDQAPIPATKRTEDNFERVHDARPEKGRRGYKPKKLIPRARISLTLEKSILERTDELAAKLNRSRASTITHAISELLKKEEQI